MHDLSKKWKFNPLKMHEKAPGGQKSNFPIQLLENGPFVEKTKINPFENALECTRGRHVGAFYWVNMHQIMRDILRGALMESLIIRKCIICRKNEYFTVWKCMKRRLVGKKAIFQYSEFPEMPPSQEGVGHAWRFFNVACFDATSYCKYEQTWPDSISAKDQEKNFLSIFPVRCGRIEADVIDSWFLGCVKSRRCANQFAYTLLFYSLKREGF